MKSFFYHLLIVFSVCCVLMIPTQVLALSLDDIIEDLKTHHNIQHITNADFRALPPENVVIFDVRKPIEYKVSHLERAIHLDPGMTPGQFMALHGDTIIDKTVVFYCSVGQRSARMLSSLSQKLQASKITQAYNLEGGAFKWHNDNLDFVHKGEVTRTIHPYSAYYAQLINDQSQVRYQ